MTIIAINNNNNDIILVMYRNYQAHPHAPQPTYRSLSNYQNLLSQLVAIIVASLMDLLTDKSMSTSPCCGGNG